MKIEPINIDKSKIKAVEPIIVCKKPKKVVNVVDSEAKAKIEEEKKLRQKARQKQVHITDIPNFFEICFNFAKSNGNQAYSSKDYIDLTEIDKELLALLFKVDDNLNKQVHDYFGIKTPLQKMVETIAENKNKIIDIDISSNIANANIKDMLKDLDENLKDNETELELELELELEAENPPVNKTKTETKTEINVAENIPDFSNNSNTNSSSYIAINNNQTNPNDTLSDNISNFETDIPTYSNFIPNQDNSNSGNSILSSGNKHINSLNNLKDRRVGWAGNTPEERSLSASIAGKAGVAARKKAKSLGEIARIVGRLEVDEADDAYEVLLPLKQKLEEQNIAFTQDTVATIMQSKVSRTNPQMAQFVARMRGELPAEKTMTANMNFNANMQLEDERAVEMISEMFGSFEEDDND